jgi:hypothetical protein
MSAQPLPKPRSLDDVHAALTQLSQRIQIVADAQLDMSEQLGKFMRDSAKAQMQAHRERETSWHDFDEQVAEFRNTLSERVKNPSDRFDSDRARAIATDAIQRARSDDKAARYDAFWRAFWKVAVTVIAGIVLAALAFAWGRLGR